MQSGMVVSPGQEKTNRCEGQKNCHLCNHEVNDIHLDESYIDDGHDTIMHMKMCGHLFHSVCLTEFVNEKLEHLNNYQNKIEQFICPVQACIGKIVREDMQLLGNLNMDPQSI